MKKKKKISKSAHQAFVSAYCNTVTDMVIGTCAASDFTVAETLSLPIQIICTMIHCNYEREASYDAMKFVHSCIEEGLKEMYDKDLQYEIR